MTTKDVVSREISTFKVLTVSNERIFDRKELKIRSGGGEKVKTAISLGKEKLSKKEKC